MYNWSTCCGCGPANGFPLPLLPLLRLSPPPVTVLLALAPVGVVPVLGGSGGAAIAGVNAGGGGCDRKGFGSSSSSGLLNVINASSRLAVAILGGRRE